MDYIYQPQTKVPVIGEYDICVIGGSCTGVFAAVRAARLGAKVAVVERFNAFGGVATNALVNVWHSLYDTAGKRQIIAGLCDEVVQRMNRNNAVTIDESNPNLSYIFCHSELKTELDLLVKENSVTPYLHTYYTSSVCEDDEIKAVIVENKNGRGAIKAKFFIDASGDGDLARDAGLQRCETGAPLQPPTYCFLLQGNLGGVDVNEIFRKHHTEFDLEDDFGWSAEMPNQKDISMRADNHVFNVQCGNADDLTFAEMEGRRKMRAFVKMLRKYGRSDTAYNAVSDCAIIGIRETFHYKTAYRATEKDLLLGKRFDDAVMNGTYRVDIHHSGEEAGITFRYLDGSEHIIYGRNKRQTKGRWREKIAEDPTFYQVPFSALVNDKIANLIPVGRMINADAGAFGALRVMVNLNQLGEAAGVAAYLALQKNAPIQRIDGAVVAKTLKTGGSAL